MKVYNGWVLAIEGQEFKVDGSMSIRGSQSYLLKNVDSGETSSISREALLSQFGKSITYVRSVKP